MLEDKCDGNNDARTTAWLYGTYSVLNNAAHLLGFYFLPEGLLRVSPGVAIGGVVAKTGSFWPQFGLTLLINLGMAAVLVVLLNLTRVNRVPTGYLYPVFMGL